MGRIHWICSNCVDNDGEVTASSFFEAASNTSNLDLNGMVPVIDFTQEWTDGLPGYSRLLTGPLSQPTLKRRSVPIDNEFIDVGDLSMGIAP